MIKMFEQVKSLNSDEIYDFIGLLRDEVKDRILKKNFTIPTDSEENPSWFPQWIKMDYQEKLNYLNMELEEIAQNR